MGDEWTPTIGIGGKLPERGQRVDWIAPSGEQVNGGRYEGLWFFPDGDLYTYYQPVMWRPAKEGG